MTRVQDSYRGKECNTVTVRTTAPSEIKLTFSQNSWKILVEEEEEIKEVEDGNLPRAQEQFLQCGVLDPEGIIHRSDGDGGPDKVAVVGPIGHESQGRLGKDEGNGTCPRRKGSGRPNKKTRARRRKRGQQEGAYPKFGARRLAELARKVRDKGFRGRFACGVQQPDVVQDGPCLGYGSQPASAPNVCRKGSQDARGWHSTQRKMDPDEGHAPYQRNGRWQGPCQTQVFFHGNVHHRNVGQWTSSRMLRHHGKESMAKKKSLYLEADEI